MNQNNYQDSVSWAQNIPKMRLRPGHWGSLQRSHVGPLAGFRGAASRRGRGKGNGGRKGGEGREGEAEGRGKEGEGEGKGKGGQKKGKESDPLSFLC